ncbi:hypothetical protein ACPA9J_08475 [Pseudomonas aeruginosa]
MQVEPRAETQHASPWSRKSSPTARTAASASEVRQRLEQGATCRASITYPRWADGRDPNSAGWMVAAQYGARDRAFFVSPHDDGGTGLHRVHRALHEVLEPASRAARGTLDREGQPAGRSRQSRHVAEEKTGAGTRPGFVVG